MSNSNMVVKGWEEHVISREKGNRVVHYRLLDNSGNSLLAVVGSEWGQRHMTYTVKKDFLGVSGPVSTVPAGTRWKSRKSVVEFLSSITSAGGPIFADSKEHKIDSTTHPKRKWMASFSSESDNQTCDKGLTQAKKPHVANMLAQPMVTKKATSSASPGPSGASEGGKKATSSATVDYKPRRIAGVEPSGRSSAASGVSLKGGVRDLKAGRQCVAKSNVRRA